MQNGIHPAILDLIRTSFNVKREGGNVNLAVSTGTQEIISSRGSLFRFLQSSRLHSRQEGQQGVNSYGVLLPGQRPHVMPEYDINPGELFDIITIDTETSGLVIGSETRSATVGRQTASVDKLGNITYQSAINPAESTSYQFRTRTMDAGEAYINGKKVPLSEFALLSEGSSLAQAIDYQANPEQAEDAIVSIFKTMLGDGTRKTRVTIHNTAFDIDFLTNTLINNVEALKPESREVLDQFIKRSTEDPFWIVDSLDMVSSTATNQVEQIKRVAAEAVGLDGKPLLKAEQLYDLNYTLSVDQSLRDKALFSGTRCLKVFCSKYTS